MPKWHLLGQSARDHQHAILPLPNPLILLHLQSKLLLLQIFVIAVHDCCILPTAWAPSLGVSGLLTCGHTPHLIHLQIQVAVPPTQSQA